MLQPATMPTPASASDGPALGRYRWFVTEDINGFFGLTFDNLAVLAWLAGILIGVFKFPADVIFTRMFPGTALGVLFGDLVYTWMAFRLAKRTGSATVTAMPLGLDTPSTIGLALVVLGPAFAGLRAEGYAEHDAAIMTWRLGMATMMFMGIIKLVFSFFGSWVQRIVPQAGLLGSLAGIGLALIGMTPLIDIFGMPLVGVVALGIVLYALVAGMKLPWRVPGVLASVVIGTVLYYLLAPLGIVGGSFAGIPRPHFHVGLPMPTLEFVKGLGPAVRYLPLSVPFALLTVVGGINVTESARCAGDNFNTRNVLLTEAVATIIAGLFGGVAQTTPYIGQPAYKNMGSRAGYTLLTGIFVGLGGMLGYVSFIVELIPRAVLAPILVFVAFDIVTQSFHAVPRRYGPAVAFAFFPTIARLLSIKLGNPEYVPPDVFNRLMTAPGHSLPELQVIVALGNGFILTGMLWAAFLSTLIDHKPRQSVIYLLILAAFTLVGIVHSALPDGSMYLPWRLTEAARRVPYQFTLAYVVLAGVIVAMSCRQTEPALAGENPV